MVADESKREAMGDDVDPEETEEALSLCDLPLYDDGVVRDEDFEKHDRRASSDQELFEFFSDLSSEMCPAEDIIFCGKIISFKEPLSDEARKSTIKENQSLNFPKKSISHRRSESLKESRSSQSSASKGQFMRNSRSLDFQKLHRLSSSKNYPAENDRNLSGKCFGKCDFSVLSPPAKPRWYLFMFGLVKIPPEMELKDIKNRQSRRNPSSLFPLLNGGETVSVNRRGEKGSWGLLRALSCKGHANAAVAASFGCIPHV